MDTSREGLDLETWRRAQRSRTGLPMSYQDLADRIGVSTAMQARRFALGHAWPRDPDVPGRIVRVTQGEVTVFAMWQRRAQFCRQQRKERGGPGLPLIRRTAGKR